MDYVMKGNTNLASLCLESHGCCSEALRFSHQLRQGQYGNECVSLYTRTTTRPCPTSVPKHAHHVFRLVHYQGSHQPVL